MARSESEAGGVQGAFFRARLALLAIATLTALPTPLTPFLGGAGEAPVAVTLAIAAAWSLLARWSGAASWLRRATPLVGLPLVIDVLGLTLLLALGGAAQNPFTMLYFVPIALSTLVSQRWTWAVAASSVVGFSALLAVTARAAGPHAQHGHFFHHVVGMAVALGVAGALVTYFVHRIAGTLGEQRAEIARLSRAQEQDRFATSLGALAAGAAHELGTPLGTVQLLAGELGLMTEQERVIAQRTIEQEVRRMKDILHGMTSSQLSAQVLESTRQWSLDELEDELSPEFPGVAWGPRPRAATTQPRAVLAQILRELLRNAQRASRGASPNVRVELSAGASGLSLSVQDHGVGMDGAAQTRALEPFVSTTGGPGLGLFLAQVHARQLGGKLELSSTPGEGTMVRLALPFAPFELRKAEP